MELQTNASKKKINGVGTSLMEVPKVLSILLFHIILDINNYSTKYNYNIFYYTLLALLLVLLHTQIEAD